MECSEPAGCPSSLSYDILKGGRSCCLQSGRPENRSYVVGHACAAAEERIRKAKLVALGKSSCNLTAAWLAKLPKPLVSSMSIWNPCRHEEAQSCDVDANPLCLKGIKQ